MEKQCSGREIMKRSSRVKSTEVSSSVQARNVPKAHSQTRLCGWHTHGGGGGGIMGEERKKKRGGTTGEGEDGKKITAGFGKGGRRGKGGGREREKGEVVEEANTVRAEKNGREGYL